MPIVVVAKIAAALNLDERRVQQLVHEGLPHESHGHYDLVKCMLFYIRYLQSALTKKCVLAPDGTYVSEREERLRLLRAKTDLKELYLAQKRRQLISVSEFEKELSSLVCNARMQLMALSDRVVAEMDSGYNRIQFREVVEEHLRRALLSLSRSREFSSSRTLQDNQNTAIRSDG